MLRKLYVARYCGYCNRVRDELERLNLPYEEITVGWTVPEREEVFRLSGQRRVPVLVEDETVIHDSARILAHLKQTYSASM